MQAEFRAVFFPPRGPLRAGEICLGVAFGVFCAAAAWAYVAPGMPKVADHLLALADTGFEEGVAPLSDGIPVRFGVWNEDYAEVVGPQQGIVQREGRRMFRFLRSDSVEERAGGRLVAIIRQPGYRGYLPIETLAAGRKDYDSYVEVAKILAALRHAIAATGAAG